MANPKVISGRYRVGTPKVIVCPNCAYFLPNVTNMANMDINNAIM